MNLLPLAASEPPSPATGWFIAMTFLLIGGINVWGARRHWRQQPNQFDRPRPSWLVFGDAFWHGLGRAYPLAAAMNVLWPVPIGFAFAVGEPGEGTLFWGSLAFSAAAFVLLSLFIATVHLLNTPKWMVAPHRRGEPGAIREWRDTRRERRHASSSEESSHEPTPRA